MISGPFCYSLYPTQLGQARVDGQGRIRIGVGVGEVVGGVGTVGWGGLDGEGSGGWDLVGQGREL